VEADFQQRREDPNGHNRCPESSSTAGEIDKARKRFGLGKDVPVISCYEAGRDGFWLHRYLLSCGIEKVVADSASIEVYRRKRRAKTDRIDVRKLMHMLLRYALISCAVTQTL
jgi:transposase